MSYNSKKVAGVFIDHKVALLIQTEDAGNNGSYQVAAKVANKHHHDHGSSENKHQHKTINEMHKYYDEVKHKLQGLDAVLLFGHGLAQEEFRNYLHEDKHFSAKEIIVKSATNLTENETIAFVRKYFSSES